MLCAVAELRKRAAIVSQQEIAIAKWQAKCKTLDCKLRLQKEQEKKEAPQAEVSQQRQRKRGEPQQEGDHSRKRRKLELQQELGRQQLEERQELQRRQLNAGHLM